MHIILNNEKIELPQYDEISVKSLLEYKQWTFPLIIVKRNGALIQRNEWATTTLCDGDTVDAIHLVSGG